MIVSEQYQVETDEQGVPIAFHKLRSIRAPHHPAPSIAHQHPSDYAQHPGNYVQVPGDYTLDIQHMPRGGGGRSVWDWLVLGVLLATGVLLLMDWLGQGWGQPVRAEQGTEQQDELSRQWSAVEYSLQKQTGNVTPPEEIQNNQPIIQQTPESNQQPEPEREPQLPTQQTPIRTLAQPSPPPPSATTQPLDSSGEWVLEYFHTKLHQHQASVAAQQQNPRRRIVPAPQIQTFRRSLLYKCTDREWLSFCRLAQRDLRCPRGLSGYERYCRELREELGRLQAKGEQIL